MGLFVSILCGTLCASWTCKSISFTKLGKFYFIIFSNGFRIFCSFFSSSWHPYDTNVGPLEVFPKAVYTILVFWGFFFLLVLIGFFASLHSKSFTWFSASFTLLLYHCKFFLTLISVSFISDWIFFMLLRSSLSSLSILITSVLNSASDKLLISF